MNDSSALPSRVSFQGVKSLWGDLTSWILTLLPTHLNVKNIEPDKNINNWTHINNDIKFLEKSKYGRVIRLERTNDTSSSYAASQNVKVATGQEYSMSVLAKPSQHKGFLGLRLSGVYQDRLDAVFDLSSSEVKNTFSGGDFHLTQASALELDDGWIKCEIRGRVSSEKVRMIFGPTNSRIRPGIWESKAGGIKEIKIIHSLFHSKF